MTLAVRDRDGGGVTLAMLNLKFVGDVVSRIRIGEAGRVYVVDSASRLIAHPNLSLVLRQTLIRDTPVFRGITERLREQPASAVDMFEARDLEGRDVMVSAAPLSSAPWLVVAEQPTLGGAGAALRAPRALGPAHAGGPAARDRRQPHPRAAPRAARSCACAAAPSASRAATSPRASTCAPATRSRRWRASSTGWPTSSRSTPPACEQKVAEKTAELELANRHKSEFLANMSHELRTPLNAVIGFSDALKERMFGDLNAKQMEYVRDINASGQHLLSLINDILDLAKIEAGRMELDVRRFDVRRGARELPHADPRARAAPGPHARLRAWSPASAPGRPTSASSSRSC